MRPWCTVSGKMSQQESGAGDKHEVLREDW